MMAAAKEYDLKRLVVTTLMLGLTKTALPVKTSRVHYRTRRNILRAITKTEIQIVDREIWLMRSTPRYSTLDQMIPKRISTMMSTQFELKQK